MTVLNGKLSEGELLAMLEESHPVYRGRGSTEAEHLRAVLMVRAVETGLADQVVDRAMADLETAGSAVVLAAAAAVIRHSKAMPPRGLDVLRTAHRRLTADDRLVDLRRFPPQPGGVSAASEISQALAALTERVSTRVDRGVTCCCVETRSVARPSLPSLAAIGNIEMETQNGVRATLGEILGDGAGLVTFFYTRCMNPLRCSHTVSQLGELARALEEPSESGRVRLAGITYDPAYDSAERLAGYGRNRSVPFGDNCQLLRTTGAFDSLAEALGLGVGFGPATVNQHRVEWLVFGPALRTVQTGHGRHWDTETIAEELLTLARSI